MLSKIYRIAEGHQAVVAQSLASPQAPRDLLKLKLLERASICSIITETN